MKSEKWQNFVERCSTCTDCALHETRKQVVISRGSLDAPLLLLGEGPGADEDEQGKPFVGQSGKLLTYLMMANGLSEEHYHVANIVKCRPPGNRKPLPQEALACSKWLEEQIKLVQPKMILLLGASAVQYLTGKQGSLSKMRGEFIDYRGIPALPTFHPAYILRDNRQRIHLWNDVCLIRKELEKRGLLPPLQFVPEMPTQRK